MSKVSLELRDAETFLYRSQLTLFGFTGFIDHAGGFVTFTIYESADQQAIGTQELLFYADNEDGWHKVSKQTAVEWS
jgi:hypothetical protein